MQFIPSYFPSIQYVHALLKADEAVFTTHAHYQKQTYRNRCSIYGANGKLNLTIPIQHKKSQGHQKDDAVKIMWEEDWQNLHWKSLTSAYRSSPFFEFYEDELKEHFFIQPDGLMDFNLAQLKGLLAVLEIDITFKFADEYIPLNRKEEELINAKKTSTLSLPSYQQVFTIKHGFIPHLSILDLIFNLGPESLDYLEQLS